MFKKVLIGIFALAVTAFITSNTYAQTASTVQLNVYDQQMVSPLKLNVKTGDTLNMEVINNSGVPVSLEVPMMNISVSVDKNTSSVVPINFATPAAKTVWFIVKYPGGDNKTGQFTVTDYTINVPTSDVNRIDTSALQNIINYDKTFTYEDKPEPVYSTTTSSAGTYNPVEQPIYTDPGSEPSPKPAKKGGYVRGYW